MSLLSDDLFLWIQGQTDSEHVFALLMHYVDEMRGDGPPLRTEQLQACFQKTFDTVQQLKEEAGVGDEVSNFNMMITDGQRIVGTRYSSNPELDSRTLYYSSGSRFETVEGKSRMVKNTLQTASVLIASEKLNDLEEDWTPIPSNHFISVSTDLTVGLIPMTHA